MAPLIVNKISNSYCEGCKCWMIASLLSFMLNWLSWYQCHKMPYVHLKLLIFIMDWRSFPLILQHKMMQWFSKFVCRFISVITTIRIEAPETTSIIDLALHCFPVQESDTLEQLVEKGESFDLTKIIVTATECLTNDGSEVQIMSIQARLLEYIVQMVITKHVIFSFWLYRDRSQFSWKGQ